MEFKNALTSRTYKEVHMQRRAVAGCPGQPLSTREKGLLAALASEPLLADSSAGSWASA